MSSEQKIEQIIVDLGLTAPRITPAMIDELMREVTYSTHVVPGTKTTVATAIDGAGFTLCAVSSASVSPENFNPALQIEIAITKARDAARAKLWELEGYRLSRALHDARSSKSTKALEQIRAVLAKPGTVESPLLTAARTLALEVGATAEELASGTAQRRQQAQVMAGKPATCASGCPGPQPGRPGCPCSRQDTPEEAAARAAYLNGDPAWRSALDGLAADPDRLL